MSSREYHRIYHRRQDVKAKQLARYHKKAATPEGHITLLITAAKGRAKRYGREFDITLEDLKPFPAVCPLLGIDLKYGINETGQRNDSPSIDRIDSKRGYVRGNVHIISSRANALKSDATADELRRIADNLDRLPASTKGD